MTNSEIQTRQWSMTRLYIAWAIALVFGVAVDLLAPREKLPEAMVLAIGLALVTSFALQLGMGKQAGFITRVSFSAVISTLIILLIGLIFWFL